MSQSDSFRPGQVFTITYPFVRTIYTDYGADGLEIKSWRPGVEPRERPGDQYDCPDIDLCADGVGEMILEIVSIHTPPGWPTRVFYIRKWRAPGASKTFGKRRLLIATSATFRRRIKGYAHPFIIRDRQQEKAA